MLRITARVLRTTARVLHIPLKREPQSFHEDLFDSTHVVRLSTMRHTHTRLIHICRSARVLVFGLLKRRILSAQRR